MLSSRDNNSVYDKGIDSKSQTKSLSNDDMSAAVGKLSGLFTNKRVPIHPLTQAIEQSIDAQYLGLINVTENNKAALKSEKQIWDSNHLNDSKRIVVAPFLSGANLGGGGHFMIMAIHVGSKNEVEQIVLYNSSDWKKNLSPQEINDNLRSYLSDLKKEDGSGILNDLGYTTKNTRFSVEQPYLQCTNHGCGLSCFAGFYDRMIGGNQSTESVRLTKSQEDTIRAALLSKDALPTQLIAPAQPAAAPAVKPAAAPAPAQPVNNDNISVSFYNNHTKVCNLLAGVAGVAIVCGAVYACRNTSIVSNIKEFCSKYFSQAIDYLMSR